jgi:hypothetical protein
MASPRRFLEEYVRPAVEEWRSEPTNIRRAMAAICELDNLTEHVILHANPRFDSRKVSRERERLANLTPDVGVVRDVHDTHKHGRLSRVNATIKNGQQPEIHQIGGGLLALGPISGGPIAGLMDELAIVFDNGSSRHGGDVIEKMMLHWETELQRLGL